jgi:hypothetical protein
MVDKANTKHIVRHVSYPGFVLRACAWPGRGKHLAGGMLRRISEPATGSNYAPAAVLLMEVQSWDSRGHMQRDYWIIQLSNTPLTSQLFLPTHAAAASSTCPF